MASARPTRDPSTGVPDQGPSRPIRGYRYRQAAAGEVVQTPIGIPKEGPATDIDALGLHEDPADRPTVKAKTRKKGKPQPVATTYHSSMVESWVFQYDPWDEVLQICAKDDLAAIYSAHSLQGFPESKRWVEGRAEKDIWYIASLPEEWSPQARPLQLPEAWKKVCLDRCYVLKKQH